MPSKATLSRDRQRQALGEEVFKAQQNEIKRQYRARVKAAAAVAAAAAAAQEEEKKDKKKRKKKYRLNASSVAPCQIQKLNIYKESAAFTTLSLKRKTNLSGMMI